jgi:uncharacterized membrane-anchored protein
MKRAFLFGLSAALFVIGVAQLIEGNRALTRMDSAAVGLVALCLATLVALIARKAFVHRAWLVKTVVWFAGFLAIPVVVFAMLYIARATGHF